MSEETIHHVKIGGVRSPCGSPSGRVSSSWPEVTCGACRLEMPEDTKGRPECEVPADVLQRDAALSLADQRARRRASQLARVDEAAEMALANVTHFARLLDDALSLRRRLLADQNGEVVPEEGAKNSGPERASERAGERPYLEGEEDGFRVRYYG